MDFGEWKCFSGLSENHFNPDFFYKDMDWTGQTGRVTVTTIAS